MRQDFIFYVHNARPINCGWFKSWQLHYAQSLIRNRQLFRAVKRGGKARIVCRFTKKQVVEAFQNGPKGPDIKDPIFRRSPYTDNCNGGDCERHKLGAEPCAGCPYCDAEGNI
jgi:hypothetical protein